MQSQESDQYSSEYSSISEIDQRRLQSEWIQNNNVMHYDTWQSPEVDAQHYPVYQPHEEVVPWPQSPWTSQVNQFGQYATPGDVAFEPSRGIPYDIYQHREGLLNSSLQTNPVHDLEVVVTNGYMEYNMQEVPPLEAPAGPLQEIYSQESNERHFHVLSAVIGADKPKSLREPRTLTAEEKQQIQKVRECRACWACHLSKTRVCCVA
jgi:hypothetical protein